MRQHLDEILNPQISLPDILTTFTDSQHSSYLLTAFNPEESAPFKTQFVCPTYQTRNSSDIDKLRSKEACSVNRSQRTTEELQG